MGTVASSIKALAYRLVLMLYQDSGYRKLPDSETRKAEMVYRILVASYTDAVYTLLFDPSKSTDESLSLVSRLTVGHHPSWIERHPSDPSIVFTGLEQEDGRLLTLRYNFDTGEGEILANVSSRGADPCSILATDENVLVANVSVISLYPR